MSANTSKSRRQVRTGPTWSAVAVVALCLPLPVGAQQPLDERLRQAYVEEDLRRIQNVVADAEARGIPPEPLLNKAVEGAAKGVSADRIVDVLGEYTGRLALAGTLVEPADRGLLVVAAEALRRGVPPDAVQAVASSGHPGRAYLLVVTGDLVEAGVSASEAESLVTSVAASATSDELLEVPAAIRRLIETGQMPDHAAAVVREVLESRGPPSWAPGGPGGGPPGTPPVPPGAGPPDGIPGKGPPSGKGRPPGGGA